MDAFVRRHVYLAAGIALLAIFSGVATDAERVVAAQQRDCTRPLPEPIMKFLVPSGELAVTRDGCWLFGLSVDATLPDGETTKDGLAALRRTDTGIALHRFLPLRIPQAANGTPTVGMALTHDDRMLVISHGDGLTFLDVGKMTSAKDDPVLGVIESPRLSRSWGVVVSADDKYAYAAQQGTASVVIVDLDTIRKGVIDQSALVGLIPTAPGATTPLLSRDGRYLFTTTLRPPDVVEPTPPCAGTKQPQGAVQVADVQRARTDPASASIAFAHPAGCNPISATLSPDGSRLVTVAPGPAVNPKLSALDSAIVAFDTRPIREGKAPTLIARVPVPPRLLRALDGGDKLFLAFLGGPQDPGMVKVTVIDTSSLASGKAKILGTLPFPAIGLALSPDSRTLYALSGLGWSSLTVVDLQRVKFEPPAN